MEKLGPRTTAFLKGLGLDADDIVSIQSGEISWDIVDLDSSNSVVAESDLLLFHSDGGHRHVACLSKNQVDELINAWEFERRESTGPERPLTFPCGDVDDWTGIRPGSDWYDLIKGYREATEILATTPPRATAAPYLYLCRHTLELQMKAVIMLGQQTMNLVPDLPSHHDLLRLWTETFPIAMQFDPDGGRQLDMVRQVVSDYHTADSGSFSFRYPVTKKNKPVAHASFVQAFSHQGHTLQFRNACTVLDAIVNRLRWRVALARMFDSPPER